MKKSFLFGLLAVALGFSACNTEDEIANETVAQKGMVLRATVGQSTKTRATISNSEQDVDPWVFSFDKDDQIKVTNQYLHDNGTYTFNYTFTKTGDNFTSDNAVATDDPTVWYACYPSDEVNLTNQSGTIADAAKLYTLVGLQKNVTGQDGLDITMQPQSAIIKLYNYKGDIDINLRDGSDEYITGQIIGNGWDENIDDYAIRYVGNSSPDKASLFTTTKAGEYYIVVPANTHFYIFNGDEFVAETPNGEAGDEETQGQYGLEAGKYYTLTIDDPNLIKGEFSVSATKKVQFTKGNLYWDGYEYQLEYNQTDFPTDWDASHVGHFHWCNKTEYAALENMPYEENYQSWDNSDLKFWCGVENPLTVNNTTGLYTLTKKEWKYLLYDRTNASKLWKKDVTIDNVPGCFILAPDDYTDDIEEQYPLDELPEGFVCLPPALKRNGSEIVSGYYGYYWSSTAEDGPFTKSYYSFYFDSDEPVVNGDDPDCGFAIRLVKTVE